MRCTHLKSRLVAVAGVALFLSACNGSSEPNSSAALPEINLPPVQAPILGVRPRGATGKIQHVVIIVQENRSFNELFYGVPGARTVKYGYTSNGKKVKLEPIGLETTWDLDHSAYSFFAACNGMGSYPGTHCRMNGFDKETWYCGGSSEPPCPIPLPPYSYVPHSETQPYFDMAKQYVLADEMFASNFDSSSFVSHEYIIAGQAEETVDYPAGLWGCPGGPTDKIGKVGPERQIPHGFRAACWNTTTLGDELDTAGISWAYYAASYSGNPGIWSAYQAIDHIYNGPDWTKDVISQPSRFLSDVANGKLRTVSWVTPTCANSDHAGCGSKTGPAWVASLVNAVGESKYWGSTAILIFWDDYGGWYDPKPPALVDYDGLGVRIPMLIISPYAKKGFVSHVHYEHGSILKFVEDQFGLPRLAASDKRANSPEGDCFDFSKPPRAFVPIPSVLGKDYFLHQPIDRRLPDWE